MVLQGHAGNAAVRGHAPLFCPPVDEDTFLSALREQTYGGVKMKATIKPYFLSGVRHGYMIVLTNAQGVVVDLIAVTDVGVEGDPWFVTCVDPENKLKLRATA